MRKIVLIIPTLKQGGAERVISQFANDWANGNYSIHLILLAKSELFYELDNRVVLHQLGFQNRSFFQKLCSEVYTFIKLRNLLRKINPSGVLSFMTKYNVFTLMASIGLGLNVYVSDRSNPLKSVPLETDILRKLTYGYAKGIIAQTTFAKQILQSKVSNKRIKVIANPVKEVKLFPDIKREKIILNVGRLVPEKGQKYLLDTFAKIKNHDWKLVILGGGILREDLEEQVRRLGIQERVELFGAVEDVDLWLARASIFVFPSVSEGFPNALVEAMSAGLPCVSFDCDAGPRDIIDHSLNGFLIPIGDIVSLQAVITELMNNEDLRNAVGEQARQIRKKFALSKISLEYLAFMGVA